MYSRAKYHLIVVVVYSIQRTINRSGNGTAEGCVSDITRGQYDINVYDQSSHMLFETFTGVDVTGERTTTTTTPGRNYHLNHYQLPMALVTVLVPVQVNIMYIINTCSVSI